MGKSPATKNKRKKATKRRSRANAHPSSPAYFLSLTIENVRCFGPAQTLDLSDGNGAPAHWTIILGDNGVGKTTLLQALALLEPIPMDDALGPDRFKGLLPRAVASRFGYRPSLMRRDGRQPIILDAKVSVGRTLTAPPIPGDSLSTAQVSVSLERYIWEHTVAETWTDGHGLICYGYGASRRMGALRLSTDESNESMPEQGCETLFSADAYLINSEEWFLQADYAASKPSAIRERIEARREKVRKILVELLPDVRNIRISGPTKDEQKPRVEAHTPYGWVGMRDLSLGYQTMIAWMVDLAARLFERYPKSRNPLREPAIVLLDEIDLHLHPTWQRKIMAYLSERFPNTQFIATAHSPLVVQAAIDANIVLLRREGDHVVIDNDVTNVESWRVDQILTSDIFGVQSARSPEKEALLQERQELLSKSRLTKKDESRLQKLEAEIGDLPTAETPQDIEAMDIIRRAAKHLKQSKGRGK